MLFILCCIYIFLFCAAAQLTVLNDDWRWGTQNTTRYSREKMNSNRTDGQWWMRAAAGWAEQKTLFLSKLNCLKQIFLILHPRSSFSPPQPPLLVWVLFNIRSLFYLHSFSLFYTIKIHFYLFSISPSPRCCVYRSSEFDCRLFNSSAEQEAWSGDDTAASRQGRFHRISNRGTLKRIKRIEMNFKIAKKIS